MASAFSPATARVVLLDLDGTLTDPGPGILRSIRYALDRLATPCPPDAVLASCIGPPLRRGFAMLLGTSERERVERAMALFRERYADTGLYENEVYEGIPAMLADLRASAGRLFVATSKPAVFAERVLQHFDLRRWFDGIYGAELAGRFDDKAELLAHLLGNEAIAAQRAVMVGDRETDVVAARANAVGSIGALWGYGSRDELVKAGADVLCATPPELVAAVSRISG